MSNMSWLNRTQNVTSHTPDDHNLSTSRIIIVTIYIAILVLGLLGNLLVIHYFGFKNKIRRLYHIYLIHLAVADLISASISSCYFVSSIVSGRTWYLGEFPCKLISLIGPVTVNVSAWLLVSIAHERYRGIISPFKPRLTKLRIHLTVAFIWMFSFLVLIPYALSIHLVDGWCRMQWSSPIYELTNAVGTLLVQSLLPIIYMTFTVKRILQVLRNRMTEGKLGIRMSKYSACSRETSFMSFRTVSSKCLTDDRQPTEEETVNSKLSTPTRHHAEGMRRLSSRPRLSVPNLGEKVSGTLIPPDEQSQNHIISSQPLLTEMAAVRNRRAPCLDSPRHFFASTNSLSHEIEQIEALLDDNNDCEPSCKSILKRKRHSSVYRRLCRFFGSQSKEKCHQRQRQRITILIVTFSVFIVCSLPYNVFYVAAIVVYDFVKDYSRLELLQNINLWLSILVLSNSIMNCFIYAGMDKNFRSYCKQLFRCTSTRKGMSREMRMKREMRKIS